MRITKIYFKRLSRVAAFFSGVVLASAFVLLTVPSPQEPEQTTQQTEQSDLSNLGELLAGYTIESTFTPPNREPSFTLTNNGQALTSVQLQEMGFAITVQSRCKVSVSQGDQHESIYCQ